VGEVAESEGVAAQRFQPAVDRFGGAVGGVVVEERQNVGAAALQGAPELSDLLQPGGHHAAYRINEPDHCLFAAAPVRIGVGSDDLLIPDLAHVSRLGVVSAS
jgi:hypothetical protein